MKRQNKHKLCSPRPICELLWAGLERQCRSLSPLCTWRRHLGIKQGALLALCLCVELIHTRTQRHTIKHTYTSIFQAATLNKFLKNDLKTELISKTIQSCGILMEESLVYSLLCFTLTSRSFAKVCMCINFKGIWLRGLPSWLFVHSVCTKHGDASVLLSQRDWNIQGINVYRAVCLL